MHEVGVSLRFAKMSSHKTNIRPEMIIYSVLLRQCQHVLVKKCTFQCTLNFWRRLSNQNFFLRPYKNNKMFLRLYWLWETRCVRALFIFIYFLGKIEKKHAHSLQNACARLLVGVLGFKNACGSFFIVLENAYARVFVFIYFFDKKKDACGPL